MPGQNLRTGEGCADGADPKDQAQPARPATRQSQQDQIAPMMCRIPAEQPGIRQVLQQGHVPERW